MKRIVAMVGMFLLLGGVSKTAEAGFYLGLGFGATEVDGVLVRDIDDGSLVAGDLDDRGRTKIIFAGYTINRYLAVESSYISGLWKGRIDATSDGSSFYGAGPVTYNGRADGYTLEAVGLLPVAGPFSVYGKGGWVWWRMHSSLDYNGSSSSFSNQGNNWLVGAGLQYAAGDRLTLRGEWKRIHGMEDLDTDLFWAGVAVGF